MFLTNAAVHTPVQPFDADDDRRLSETCDLKERQPQWGVKHPPQQTAQAVRVHVMFTLLMCALATADRRPCEPADTGSAAAGWQRWRRPRLEQTRDHVIVVAEGSYGIVHLAEYSLRLGVTINDRPPGSGTRQQILATYGRTAHG